MKRFLLIATLMIALTGCSSQQSDTVSQEPVEKTVETITVETDIIGEAEIVSDLTVPGQVKADKIQSVVSIVSGQINFMEAEVGDRVKTGDTLVKLDDTLLQIKKRQAEIGNKLYKLSLDSAQRTFNRTDELYKSGNATQSQFEDVNDLLTKAQLDYANGKVNTDELNYNMNHMTVKAPMDGMISKKYQQLGVSVGPGTPLYDIVDITTLTVAFGVTEKDINRLKSGQSVSVNLPTLGIEKTGIIKGISPLSDSDQTYPVRVEIENDDLSIKPGMFAELKIVTDAPRKVIALPKVAVLHEEGIDYVYLVNGTTATKQTIKLGSPFEDQFEVLSGLKPGDQIVTSGQAYLEDGNTITISQ
ncbi:efflux RND transporter periplasmic adaptor subunit [Fusibacter ferrireducens]|uniref:Efflux RND transporter periplasmic adaptor subunit n=1 Tax=Fusibacter ferrireducens TaxID=2785058 RepID=A0ABR9ZQB3_9FIRM|nr:efflux RND transporter periplasmic adaptor subunit [Fusibacter ferrireducens]MBF4692328.1 efflux RND transporter periplasmic adaptor subunit [Fusibacter ferrireducens]